MRVVLGYNRQINCVVYVKKAGVVVCMTFYKIQNQLLGTNVEV